MKRLVYILCFATALVTGLTGCGQKEKEEPVKIVDLRYRANDSYNLTATGAQAFTILVVSSDPWTITSDHPDWCIISEEEGAASDAELVHTGKAEVTTVRVQYYDNVDLDDRVDKITIKSDYWVGKVITVTQKGCAFLTIPEADMDLSVVKAGGDYVIHINSNQDWGSKVTDGSWLSIKEGATGNGTGNVVVAAEVNTTELRYGEVTVYDRHDAAVAAILFTQDGVQLVPAGEELRAGYDQLTGELEITANTKWTVSKASENDDWFDILTTEGEGSGVIKLSFTQNDGDGLRTADILVKNVVSNPEDFQVEKTIVVKQAYRIDPVRTILTTEELENWSKPNTDWPQAAVYTKDLGTTFYARGRINRSMAFGTYTFRWSHFVDDPEAGAPQVRHWFCFNESLEIKSYLRPGDGKVSYEFNTAGDGNKPTVDSFYDVDWTQPVDFTIKFEPSGAEHCHVSFLVNGKPAGSFDSSATFMRTVKWGSSINMYIGVDTAKGSAAKTTAASAVCEWIEYTPSMNWD